MYSKACPVKETVLIIHQWRTSLVLLKQEMYYGEALRTYKELKRDIESYINYYNNKRIKTKIGWHESGSIPSSYQPISCVI